MHSKSKSKPLPAPTPAPRQAARYLVNNHMVCFAFRYALGRRTGAVGIVVDHLTRLWHDLTNFDRKQIKREITRAIMMGEAGESCDVEQWNKVLQLEHGGPPLKV